MGNELLGHVYKDAYDESTKYRSSQHTVRRVMAITTIPEIKLPINWNFQPLVKASDMFVGYLILDALIGNQDRHHENWGLLVMGEQLYIAPTFDHASSLGRNETDENRSARLSTTDAGYTVDSYVRRAKSALHETPTSGNPLTTIEAFQEASKIRPNAGRYWLGVLEKVDFAAYKAIFNQVPPGEISKVGIEFALKMLECNTRRLLETKG